MYSSRTGNRELYERLRAKHLHLYNKCYASSINGIENDIKRDPKQFFDYYKRKTALPQCDMTTRWVTVPLTSVNFFADLFEGVGSCD
jgi:hypothetical protein